MGKEKRSEKERGKFYRAWSNIAATCELSLLAALLVTNYFIQDLNSYSLFNIIMVFVAWSRVNELVYAFGKDSLNLIRGGGHSSNLAADERLIMALKNYLSLLLYFAIFYYFGQLNEGFKNGICSFFDGLYFSVVTQTTLGYGDVTPSHWVMKVAAIYQVLIGLLMVVVVISTYASAISKKQSGD